MRHSIRWQLIFIMCTLIALAVGGTLLLIRPIITADYERRIENSNSAMAVSISQNIRQFIYTEEVVAGTAVDYPNLMQLSKGERREVLARTVAQHPSIQRISLTDMEGRQVARSEGMEISRRQSNWYQAFVQQRRPMLTNLYYAVSDQDMPVMSLIYGVHQEGKLVGILQAVVNMDVLQRIVAGYRVGDGSYAFLLGGDGTMLAHPEINRVKELYNYTSFTRQVLQRNEDGTLQRDAAGEVVQHSEDFAISPSQKHLIQQALAGSSGAGEYEDLDGQQYLCVYRPIVFDGLSEPWYLFVVQKRSTAMAFMADVTATSLSVAAIVVLLAGGLIVLFSRRITRPVELMSVAAERIKEGDLSVEVPVQRENELGILAEAFNNMVQGLRHMKSEQLKAEERIRAMAYHDPLTGLPNRASLHKFLGASLQASDGWLSGAILFIDLDDFKSVNDRFGHAMGDAVLVIAAERIRQAAGSHAFVCRLGGDEFVVAMLGEGGSGQGILIGEAIVDSLQRDCRIRGLQVPLSGSIGIATVDQCCSSVDELLHAADGAMYAAKHAGRSCWKLYQREVGDDG